MTEVFLHLTEQCLYPVWLRNAAVQGDRGALCAPYVTPGCLEAATRACKSDSTLPTCVTVTSGEIHDHGKSYLEPLALTWSRENFITLR